LENKNIDSTINTLIPAERRRTIIDILQSKGSIRVSELSIILNVSEITIRRDLELLEKKGYLERTFGGAILYRRLEFEPLFSEKDHINIESKRAIALAAASLVDDNETILINSGSTTLRIFQNFIGKKNLTVLTNNIGSVLEAQGLGLNLILTGGQFREQSNSLIGPIAIQNIQKVFADKCFIGVDGISIRQGLTTPILEEAEIARAMIGQTRKQVIVVADSSKLGVVSNYLSANIRDINTLVTSSGIDSDFHSELVKLKIDVIIVP
jgi:DeoR family fructose operon transcriptional repressor